MTRGERIRLAGALVLGAVLAFPLGMMVTGGHDREPPLREQPAPALRNVYSPQIVDDPWFLEQQRRNVQALEAHCRRTGESCGEARAARTWLEEQQKAD